MSMRNLRAVLRESEIEEAQTKMEAWQKVGSLVDQALQIMVNANIGPVEQAMLMHISEKAPIQVGLWNLGGE